MREATANKKAKNGLIHVFRLWLKQGQNVVQRHSEKVIIIFLVSITI